MSTDQDCIFCKIVAGRIPASIVFQSDGLLSFLDIGPLADGHLLVIPREHCDHFSELSPETSAQIGEILPRLARALREVTKAKGLNILINEGAIAGQVVPHVHVHLIPRSDADGLGYRWQAGKYPEGRAEQLTDLYKRALSPT